MLMLVILLLVVGFRLRLNGGVHAAIVAFRWSVAGRWSMVVSKRRKETDRELAIALLLPQIGVVWRSPRLAALLYVSFSERTLVRLAYQEG